MESDAWQIVSKKKASKKPGRKKGNPLSSAEGHLHSVHSGLIINSSDAIKKLKCTMEDLRISDFWDSCQGYIHKCENITPAASKGTNDSEDLVKSSCQEEDNVSPLSSLQHYDCVCYGLGNFTSCVISRHQLAFLLLFLEQFKIPHPHCCVFDPIFSPLEVSVLQELGLNVVFSNEEGKHAVHKPTVFYMPHCGKALYNNLLWRNWSSEALSQMIIIGNSFRSIEERVYKL